MITLTESGKALATQIEKRDVRMMRFPKAMEEFRPSNDIFSVTLADEILLYLNGNNGDVNVAKLVNVMQLPPVILNEILFELSRLGLIIIDDALYSTSERPTVLSISALLGNSQRLKILMHTTTPRNSTELRSELNDAPMMTMRHHLIPMIDAGLIEKSRDGKMMQYSIVRLMLAVYVRRLIRYFELI